MSRVYPRAMPKSVVPRTSAAQVPSSPSGYNSDSAIDGNSGDVSDSEPSSEPMALAPLPPFLVKCTDDVKTGRKNTLEQIREW
ncbi:hypothetical protein A0H81_04373 [Grifola frondosa]|uniref:Uncharacterized protein n=1 Tax=Grifola frondosa TaxID=5627 RepID=A0A1C7MFK4_GRIFR|nr:hypothetical protein A0H81_04373 [Grifola frondosa]